VVSQLSKKIRGNVITPANSEYEVARKVYNGMIDRRPAAIVRCADVADVMSDRRRPVCNRAERGRANQ
jgi:hypothetical protein